MDNEACDILKKTLLQQKISYQLVPLYIHCWNFAERAIQTPKYHFIAGLCAIYPKYPSQEWDSLLPQATMNLNLLWTSRTNPKLSAYSVIFIIHYFNWCSLEPPGTRVIFHKKTYKHCSWSPHGTDGYYIGSSMEHYRCVQSFITATSSVCNVDTLTFFPDAFPFPKIETENYLWQSVGNILAILSKPKTQLPFLTYGDTTTSIL